MGINDNEFNNFERNIFKTKCINNFIISAVIYVYSIFLCGKFDFIRALKYKDGLFQGDAELQKQSLYALGYYSIVVLIIYIVLQLIFGTILNHYLCNDLSKKIEYEREKVREKDFENSEDSKIIRTLLLKQLCRFPLSCAIEAFILFTIGTVASGIVLIHLLQISFARASLLIIVQIFCVIDSSIVTYQRIEHFCEPYNHELMKYGLSEKIVSTEHFWGLNIYARTILNIIIPCCISFLTLILFMKCGFEEKMDPSVQILHVYAYVIFTTSAAFYISLYYKQSISKSTYKMNSLLKKFSDKASTETVFTPVSFTTETDYNIYMVNHIITDIHDVTKKSTTYIDNILNTTKELSISSENAEIIAEDKNRQIQAYIALINNSLSNLEQVSEKIKYISDSSKKINSSVQEGSEILALNDEKIKEIIKADSKTVHEINELSNYIDSIFDVITTIESIAEKTRIIAFNAEIETSAAGESGTKFHIITNEIRRLASAITESIQEIKDKLKFIQETSDNLIISSEAGTQKIIEGCSYIENLTQRFDELKISSEITEDCTHLVNSTIDSQTVTFNEIETDLKKVSNNFNYFAKFFKEVSTTTDEIDEISLRFKMSSHTTDKDREAQFFTQTVQSEGEDE